MGYFITVDKVFERGGAEVAFIGIDEDELDLHSFGDDALYENTCRLPCRNPFFGLGKSCEVGHKFNENAVTLNASHYSRYRLALADEGGVFLPCAKQFFVR